MDLKDVNLKHVRQPVHSPMNTVELLLQEIVHQAKKNGGNGGAEKRKAVVGKLHEEVLRRFESLQKQIDVLNAQLDEED